MVNDLTPAQSATILRAALSLRGRIPAVAHRTAAALGRKGYATVTYRHTSNGYLADLTLTPRGRKALAILHRGGGHHGETA